MDLIYTSPFEAKPGTIAWLLNESYAELVEAEPQVWAGEKANWEESDRNVFENPNTIGACTFLSWYEGRVVGLFSFDPRDAPAYGVIGHNCILPAYQKRGFGKEQVHEILRRLSQRGIRKVWVCTNDHPFFLPARRMYRACGFVEVGRTSWGRDQRRNVIHLEKQLG